MEELILVRHGKTDYNKEDRICGITDIPLNKEGIKQVHKLAKIIGHSYPIEKIYSSPLIRAIKTAEIIDSYLNIGYSINKNLCEMNFGSREGLLLSEAKKKYDYLKRERDKNIMDFRFPKSESYRDCVKRAKTFLEEIIDKPNKTVLVVTHAMMIRCFQHLILKEDINKLRKKYILNAQHLILKLQ